MKFLLKATFILSFIFAGVSVIFAQSRKPVCAFLPFQNTSDFKNEKWEIERGIPRAFSDSLINSGLFQVISLSRVEDLLTEQNIQTNDYKNPELLQKVSTALGADHLIFGEINLFDLSRTNIGDPMLGGFESYSVVMEASFSLYNRLAGTISGAYSIQSEVKEKDLGVTFVGRPSKNYISFRDLDKMAFNSSDFNKTILGAGLQALVAKFYEQMIELIPVEQKRDELDEANEFVEAMIVFKRDNEVYLNAGVAEKVRVGKVYPVYSKGEKILHPDSGELLGYTDKYVGKVKVQIVKDNHLSMAEIIEEIEPIKTKDTVRIEKE